MMGPRDTEAPPTLQQLAARWDIRTWHINNPPNVWTAFVPADPQRWWIIFAANGANCYVNWDTKFSPGLSVVPFTVPTQVPYLQFSYNDFGGLVQLPWYVVSTAANVDVWAYTGQWKGQ